MEKTQKTDITGFQAFQQWENLEKKMVMVASDIKILRAPVQNPGIDFSEDDFSMFAKSYDAWVRDVHRILQEADTLKGVTYSLMRGE